MVNTTNGAWKTEKSWLQAQRGGHIKWASTESGPVGIMSILGWLSVMQKQPYLHLPGLLRRVKPVDIAIYRHGKYNCKQIGTWG